MPVALAAARVSGALLRHLSEHNGLRGVPPRHLDRDLGRPALQERAFHRESRDTVVLDGRSYTSDQATIWRWRKHFQHDFAARMDWCVSEERSGANHNPIAHLNGDGTRRVLEIEARPGETVRLSSDGSRDPDGDALRSS